MEIAFSSSFKKAFRKIQRTNKTIEQKFWKKTEVFISDPFHKSIYTHKLSGELKNYWSFSVDYDCRIVFYFKTKTKVVFTDIGTRDEVY